MNARLTSVRAAFLLVLLVLSFLHLSPARAQEPLSFTIQIDDPAGTFRLPAVIELRDLLPGREVFTGVNGGDERGAPLFSAEVEEGAVFYPGITVTGFPNRTSTQSPYPNRPGKSNFIAVKAREGKPPLVWVCASMGGKKFTPETNFDWEYQLRYFSGDGPWGPRPESVEIGTVPNANSFGGITVLNNTRVAVQWKNPGLRVHADMDVAHRELLSGEVIDLGTRYVGEEPFEVNLSVENLLTTSVTPIRTMTVLSIVTILEEIGSTSIPANASKPFRFQINSSQPQEFEIGLGLSFDGGGAVPFACTIRGRFASNQLAGRVVEDTAGAPPVAGATVSLFDTMPGTKVQLGGATTDAQGEFLLDAVASGNVVLRVEKQGFRAFLQETVIRPRSDNYKVIRLAPEDGTLQLTSKYTAPGRGTTYFLEGVAVQESFRAVVGWGVHEPGEVRWFKNGAQIATDTMTGNAVTRAFTLGTDYRIGDRLAARAYSSTGDLVTPEATAAFEVVPRPFGDVLPNGFMGNSYVHVPDTNLKYEFVLPFSAYDLVDPDRGVPTLPAGYPFLGGQQMKLARAASVRVSVNGDGTGRIILQTEQKQKQHLLSGLKKLSSRWVPSFTLFFGGGAALKYDGAGTWLVDGGTAKAGGKYEISSPPVYAGWIPLYAAVKIMADMVADLTFHGFLNDGVPELKGTVTVEPALEVVAGAGLYKVIAAELYGRGSIKMRYQLSPEMQWAELKAILAYGWRSYAMLHEKSNPAGYSRYDFLTEVWEHNPPSWFADKASDAFAGSIPMSRQYLKDQYALFTAKGAKDAGAPVESSLETNVFPESHPAIVRIGEDLLAVWLWDDPERAPMDRTALVYSIFNGQEWSAPLPVASNGRADLSPSLVALPDGNALAVWQNSKTLLPAEATVAQMAAVQEIVASRYDAASSTWGPAVALSNNDQLDHSVALSVGADGTVLAAWISNAGNELYGSASAPDAIHCALFNGSAWGSVQVARSQVSGLVRLAPMRQPASSTILYSADTDGNRETEADIELFSLAQQGSDAWLIPQRLTNNAQFDINPMVANLPSGNPAVIWQRGDTLVWTYGAALDFESPALIATLALPEASGAPDSLVALGPDGRLALVWQATGGENPALSYTLYDFQTGQWSTPLGLAGDTPLEKAPAFAFTADGALVGIYNKLEILRTEQEVTIGAEQITIPDFPQPGASDLAWVRIPVGVDLALEAIALSPENASPMTSVEATVTLRNLGALSADNPTVALYAADPAGGAMPISSIVPLGRALGGGESVEIAIPWVVADGMAAGLWAAANTAGTDLNPANNTIRTVPFAADLSVAGAGIETAGTTALIVATLRNVGGVASGTAQLVVRDGDAEGTEVARAEVATLGPGESRDHFVQWDNVPAGMRYAWLGLEQAQPDADPNNDALIARVQDEAPAPVPAPQFSLTPSNVLVEEDATGEVAIRLTSRPAADVVGTVVKLSGDDSLTVQSGTPFTIKESAWETAVVVVLAAAEDDDTDAGTAQFEVRETSANGIAAAPFTATEMDNDNFIDIAAGTLEADAIWDDTTRVYRLTGDLTIPAGMILTIRPGVRVLSNYQIVNLGEIRGEGSLLRLRGDAEWEGYTVTNPGYDSYAYVYGIRTGGSGRLILTDCEVEGTFPATAGQSPTTIGIGQTATGEFRGCAFRAVEGSPGVAIEWAGGATVTIGDDAEGNLTSFRGFSRRETLKWQFGAGVHTVGFVDFVDCGEDPIGVYGTVPADKTVELVNRGIRSLDNLSVTTGGTLRFLPGSSFDSRGQYIIVGGAFEAEDADMLLTYVHNVLNVNSGATATLRGCRIEGRTTDPGSDSSRIINIYSGGSLRVEGCDFSTDPAGRTRTAIWLEDNTTAFIGDDAAGRKTRFENFYRGIYWPMGTGGQTVEVCDFTGCDLDVQLINTSNWLTGRVVLRNARNQYGDWGIAAGGVLELASGSGLLALGDSNLVNLGEIRGEGSLLRLRGDAEWEGYSVTNPGYDSYAYVYGIRTGGNGRLILTDCEVEGTFPTIAGQSPTTIGIGQGATAEFRGCAFRAVEGSPGVAIEWAGGATVTIADDAEGNRTSFHGFNRRETLKWRFGTGAHAVGLVDFVDCGKDPIGIYDTVPANKVVELVNRGNRLIDTVVVAVGGTLRFLPGSSFDSRGRYLNVSGIFEAEDADLLLTYGLDGLSINSGGAATLRRCRIAGETDQPGSDSSCLIDLEPGGSLRVEGCDFSTDPAARTRSAIYMNDNTTAFIGDDAAGRKTRFANFFRGIYWPMGTGGQTVDVCDFTGCDLDVHLIGTGNWLTGRVVLRNARNQYGNWGIAAGGVLELAPGSGLLALGDSNLVNLGEIRGEGSLLRLRGDGEWEGYSVTNPGYDSYAYVYGIRTGGSGRLILTDCEVEGTFPTIADQSPTTIGIGQAATAEFRGCAFRAVEGSPGVAIEWAGGATVTIGDDDEGNRTSFRGFSRRETLKWQFGTGAHSVGLVDFVDCTEEPINVYGTVPAAAVVELRNPAHYLGDHSAVSAGGELYLMPGSALNLRDRWINPVSGKFIADRARIENPGSVYYGNIIGHDSCDIRLTDTVFYGGHDRNEHSSIGLEDLSLLAVQNCYFKGLGQTPGILLWNNATRSVTIRGSKFSGFRHGLDFGTVPGTLSVANNDFEDCLPYGVWNNSTTPLPMVGNWWGEQTGPRHETNPGGTGVPITNNVPYVPNLLAPAYPQVFLTTPEGGQKTGSLTGLPNQAGAELLHFKAAPGGSTIGELKVRVRHQFGLVPGDLRNLRLVLDDNGNGTLDAEETTRVGGTPRRVEIAPTVALAPAEGWRWVTGEEWEFTNWQTGQPNDSGREEGRLILDPNNSLVWDDGREHYTADGFIVEFDPTRLASADTNVDFSPVLREGTDHWFAFVRADVTWAQAHEMATSYALDGMEGYLATLTSAEELEWVRASLEFSNVYSRVWAGGYQPTDLEFVFHEPIPIPDDPTKGLLLLADVPRIDATGGFMVETVTSDVVPGMPEVIQTVAPGYHYLGGLVVAAPPTGQVGDGLGSSAIQTGVPLLGLRLFGREQAVASVTFALSDVTGLDAGNFATLRLIRDTNGNAVADAGEPAAVGTPVVAVDTTAMTGTIRFDEPLTELGAYLLVGDLEGLRPDDRFSIGLPAANVVSAEGDATMGSVAATQHQVDFAPVLTVAFSWLKPKNFGVQASQTAFPFLGFRLVPVSTEVASVKVPLSSVIGIEAADMANPIIVWDENGNGLVDAAEQVLSRGTVSIANNRGEIQFPGFVALGNLLVAADFANLEAGDEFSAEIHASDITMPPGEALIGYVPVQRYWVQQGVPEGGGSTMQWTMNWRSPGGTSVNGQFNNGGDKLILGFDTGSAWIYDAKRPDLPLLMLKDHYDSVVYAGFNSDDTAAVTVTRDGAVFIWEADSGRQRTSMFSDLLVTSAIPSPDFSRLMVLTQGKAILLDIDNQRRLWEFQPGGYEVRSIAYSPDGSQVALGTTDRRAYLLNSETGVIEDRFTGHAEAVTAVEFTGDGSHLVTSSTDGVIQYWNIAEHYAEASIALGGGVQCVRSVVSADGSRIALVTNTAELRMYDYQANLQYSVDLGQAGNWAGYLQSLTFNRQGTEVLVTSAGWGWCGAEAFQVSNGAKLRDYYPLGHFDGSFECRPKLSNDGKRLFTMNNTGVHLIPTTPGEPIRRGSRDLGARWYDINADGSLFAWTNGSTLYVDSVNDAGFTDIVTRNHGSSNGRIALSASGAWMQNGDRLVETLSGRSTANYAYPDGNYMGAFSPDERRWGFFNGTTAFTLRTGDPRAVMEYTTLTDPYAPYKMLYHPDNERIGVVSNSTSYTNGVQFYNLRTEEPAGLYLFDGYSSDASLSEDGTLLLIGGENVVKLYDVARNRIVRYFYPMHSSFASVTPRAVQFARNDTMIMIAWNYNYVELYERTKAMELELTPGSRVLAAGQSQDFTVNVVQDDGTRRDVSPRTGDNYGRAKLTSTSTMLEIVGSTVTVKEGATGEAILIALYRERGQTFRAQARITVGTSSLVALEADPTELAVTPGYSREIRYLARYDDGYTVDVTQDVALSSSRPEQIDILDQTVQVLMTARPGEIIITGDYADQQGDTASATTTLSCYGLRTAWERTVATPGGYGNSGDFSPNKALLAVGYSSGGVALYNTGASPQQFTLRHMLMAHDRACVLVKFLSDTDLLTVGEDGRIRRWTLTEGVPAEASSHTHPAAITAAKAYWNGSTFELAFGDSDGKVGLYDLGSGAQTWLTTPHTDRILSVDLNETGVLAGSKDRLATVLDRATGETLKTITTHTGKVVSVGFMGSSKFFTLGADAFLSFWENSGNYLKIDEVDFPSQPTVGQYLGNSLYIGLAQSEKSKRGEIVSTWIFNGEGALQKWFDLQPAKGKIAFFLPDPDGRFLLTGRTEHRYSVFISPPGEWREVVSPFASVQFYETTRGIFRGWLGHSQPLVDIHVSPSDNAVYTQCEKRTVRWAFEQLSANTPATSSVLMETGYFINPSFTGMDFTYDGSLFATRVQQSIYLFNTVDRILWKSLHTNASAFALSGNGQRMVTLGDRLRLWDLISLSAIREDPRQATLVGFLPTNAFLTAWPLDEEQAGGGLGYWDAGALLQEGADTAHGPIAMHVNRTGTRAAVITKEVIPGILPGEAQVFYYLETFDVSNPGGGMPRIGPPVLLSANRSEIDELLDDTGKTGLTGDGLKISSAAFSSDGALLLVGSSKDAYLIDAAGRMLQRFEAPSESTSGISAVAFADEDRAVAIGWTEGYASIHRRLTPTVLDVGVESLPAKKGLTEYRRVSTVEAMQARAEILFGSHKDIQPTVVSPGQALTALAFVRYENGQEQNVSSSVVFSATPAGLVEINGLELRIVSDAPAGARITIVATYEEPGHQIVANTELVVDGATPTPSPTPTIIPSPTPTPLPCVDPLVDTDRDGLPDCQEAVLGTNPALKDSDGDGIEDGVEYAANTDPLDDGDPPSVVDTDRDGIPDDVEDLLGLDPNNPDSDGDGYLDSWEVATGSNANDPASKPVIGDVDGDGAAGFVDAIVIFNVFLGNLPAEDYALPQDMDINRDGVIDSIDAIILLNWFLGNINYIPFKAGL